jgi:hypothetical protein
VISRVICSCQAVSWATLRAICSVARRFGPGGKLIAVAMVRITTAGRDALGENFP